MGQEAVTASLLPGAHSSSVGLRLNPSLWAAEGTQQIHAGQLCRCAHSFEAKKPLLGGQVHHALGKQTIPGTGASCQQLFSALVFGEQLSP